MEGVVWLEWLLQTPQLTALFVQIAGQIDTYIYIFKKKGKIYINIRLNKTSFWVHLHTDSLFYLEHLFYVFLFDLV